MWLTRHNEHTKEMQNMILKWSTLYSLDHIVAVQTGRGANKRDGRNESVARHDIHGQCAGTK